MNEKSIIMPIAIFITFFILFVIHLTRDDLDLDTQIEKLEYELEILKNKRDFITELGNNK